MGGLSSEFPSSGHYEIVEEESFNRMANAIEPDRAILDAKLQAITFVIARVPRLFHLVHGSTMLRAAFYNGTPQMRIWFSFDGQRVYLLGIEVIDDS